MGAEVVLDGIFGVRGLAFGEPLFGGQRVGGGKHLHLVTSVETFVAAHHTGVDFSSDAVVSEVGMDGIGEIEHSAARGQCDGAATRGEDVNLFGIEGFLELLDEVEGTLVALLQRA